MDSLSGIKVSPQPTVVDKDSKMVRRHTVLLRREYTLVILIEPVVETSVERGTMQIPTVVVDLEVRGRKAPSDSIELELEGVGGPSKARPSSGMLGPEECEKMEELVEVKGSQASQGLVGIENQEGMFELAQS
jgi:hypothetical protein